MGKWLMLQIQQAKWRRNKKLRSKQAAKAAPKCYRTFFRQLKNFEMNLLKQDWESASTLTVIPYENNFP